MAEELFCYGVPRDLRTSRVLPPRLVCPRPPPSAGMQGLMAPRPSWKPVETPGPTGCWLSRQHISSLPPRDRHSLSRERMPRWCWSRPAAICGNPAVTSSTLSSRICLQRAPAPPTDSLDVYGHQRVRVDMKATVQSVTTLFTLHRN